MIRLAIRIGAAAVAVSATAFLAGEIVVVEPVVRAAARGVEPAVLAELIRWRLIGAGLAVVLGTAGWSLWAGVAQRRDAHRRAAVVGMVAHDVRGPLTGIRLAAERLARVADAGAERAAIERECRRLEALADDLLSAGVAAEAAVDRDGGEPLSELLEDVTRRVRGSTGVPVALRLDAEVADASALPGLSRAVGNLLDNAARHARGGPIEVRARRVGADLEIAVADDGDGFASGFGIGAFRRGPRGGRAGLGLASAARIAARLDGALAIGRGDRSGAVVSLRVPGGARR